MSTIIVFLVGIAFLVCILFLRPRIQKQKTWQKVVSWILFVLWYAVTCAGISFVFINASIGHAKATSTAVFIFGGVSVILLVVLARVVGIIRGPKKSVKPIEEKGGEVSES